MPANMTKIMGEVPRALQLAAQDYASEGPIGRTRVPVAEQAKRLEPIMGMIAGGQIPLDEKSAQAVATYLEEHHKNHGQEDN